MLQWVFRTRQTLLVISCLILSLSSSSLTWSGESPEQFKVRTQDWRDAKFGMFIHWGLYSIPADRTDKNGKLPKLSPFGEWFYANKAIVDKEDYEKLAHAFDPNLFDAKAWVKAAKDAGMKYLVVTTKHHDGFSMFPTQLSKFSVKNTSFKLNPIQELSLECQKQGILFGIYYSLLDWNHDDYYPHTPSDRRCWGKGCTRRLWNWATGSGSDSKFNRYVEYMKGQLTELLTGYGPVHVVWFDGQWMSSADRLHSQELVDLIRKRAPQALINDRLSLDRDRFAEVLEVVGIVAPEKRVSRSGDFASEEGRIPGENEYPKGRLWETCMTMNDTWGYVKGANEWKSSLTLLRNLIEVVSKGGNFLLNVGPQASGEFPSQSLDILKDIGQWIQVNGRAVYETQRCPSSVTFQFQGYCTARNQENALFLQVFEWPKEGLIVSGLKREVTEVRTLDGNEPLDLKIQGTDLLISQPSRLDPNATVIELTLKASP